MAVRRQRTYHLTASFIVLYFALWNQGNDRRTVVTASAPEASSTLLRMHRLYLQQPPHDTSLYDVLGVTPNATAAEITKSYRRLSRVYHPDKQGRGTAKEQSLANHHKLEQVRQAYEVLKDDQTRLPYHRYGLLHMDQALLLLAGRQYNNNNSNTVDSRLAELLRLMGYPVDLRTGQRLPSRFTHHHQTTMNNRVWFLAINLVEFLRPLIEGVVPERELCDIVARKCDRLKTLPMGAQILRCIGRAYRYSGQRTLRRYPVTKEGVIVKEEKSLHMLDVVTDRLRDHWRSARHVLNAAVASGRVVLTEKVVTNKSKEQRDVEHIAYHNENDGFLGALPGEEATLENALPSDAEMRDQERQKAMKVLLESLQVEALWKICKIDLDRTIREACDLILEGDYFFSPGGQAEGWVGSKGMAIDAKVGRVRAAAALVLVGNVMVESSKEGTSWMR